MKIQYEFEDEEGNELDDLGELTWRILDTFVERGLVDDEADLVFTYRVKPLDFLAITDPGPDSLDVTLDQVGDVWGDIDADWREQEQE